MVIVFILRAIALHPDLTLLGSSANWIKYATSNKMTAGTLLDLSGTATTG
ncbi:hypothetical protein J802_4128 [Acinetobacter baumannii 45002_9]|nr:hypothetical protein J802_4128 [Acinetobacter baumannii 45002_9]